MASTGWFVSRQGKCPADRFSYILAQMTGAHQVELGLNDVIYRAK